MAQPTQEVLFGDVASRLSASLLRYLRHMVGDEAVAEDLLQETLLRVARGLPNFAGRASLKTWAFAIATHVATDYFRNPKHRLAIVEVDQADDLPDPAPLADEDAIVNEMNACVRGVLDGLPDVYRAALILHDLEGLTAEQTAEICECSLASVKIRIHRARLRLKDALKRQCSFYDDPDGVFRCDRKV